MAEKIRLLRCFTCKTLEEIPYYEGDPKRDFLLQAALRPHQPEHGPNHFGQLYDVEKEQWAREEVKKQVLDRLKIDVAPPGQGKGLGDEYYNLKNTFMDDAMSCWQAHQRNPACSDYKSDAKKLTPSTVKERVEAGLPKYKSPQDRYLCEFCPVHQLVITAHRSRKGMYD